MSNLPTGILLAAGHSRRFGSNKLLHIMDNGIAMLLVSAEKLVATLPDSIAVISEELAPYAMQLEQLGMSIVTNRDTHRGMGYSIACGVNASQDATGWLVTLADMPYLHASTLQKLATGLAAGANIIAPLYQQQRGHPVGFQRHYREALMALDGDTGARQIIEHHQDQLELVTTTDAGVVTDIDEISDIYPAHDNN